MKNLRPIMMVVLAVLVSACGGSSSERVLPGSIGKPYEIIVEAPDAVWKSNVGDTLKAIFGANVEMLNEPEPLYDLISITPDKVNSNLARHRNIMRLSINAEKYPKTVMNAEFSAVSQDQVAINIYSASVDSMTNYIWENRATILGLYDKMERDRFVSKAAKYRNDEIGKAIQEKFGFTMDIPTNYKIRNQKDSLIWISYELPLASLGIVIYTFEPRGEKVDLFAERDAAVKNIPGPSDGSYMKTDTTFMPMYKGLEINGIKWVEMRGFWNVKHDFMGGAFVNFTTKDPVTGKMLGVDCYVHSPSTKLGMRNYIRQLEALVMTIKFKK